MVSALGDVRRRLSRLGRDLPQPAPADMEELRVAVLRLTVVLEHWAAHQPGYSTPPGELLCETALARLLAWDESGDLPVTLNLAHGPAWLARLREHLGRDGWRDHLQDSEHRLACFRRSVAVIAGDLDGALKPMPELRQRARVLPALAKVLARIEAQGAAPPRWLPESLLAEARAITALDEKIMAMNSEQRWNAMRALLIKCGAIRPTENPPQPPHAGRAHANRIDD